MLVASEALLAFGLTFGAFASIFAFAFGTFAFGMTFWAFSTSILAFAFDAINIHGLRPELQADADQRVWLASHLSIKRSEVRVLDQRVAVHKSKLLNQLTVLSTHSGQEWTSTSSYSSHSTSWQE